ncbi:hypothetical protein J19TS2_63180 [Cohnella xylanilytica]|uniref:hypothetical protein n=1 Tax=Cohnella xylanilytica TaxID=557555 RepID=UPI001B24A520|nr:hypothetical protein [Cohnella xylanilytica]GIO16763.1 hypothetical protein J19TS2_63180 [Cohnella xylanilytica]
MNRYLKLVHMEIQRFRYFLLGLMALTLVGQVLTVAIATSNEVAKFRDPARFSIASADKLSFEWIVRISQGMFALPILISMAALLFYVFLIWYRDWLGRSTFMYRLLALPTARRNLYLSKLTAIVLFVFALLSFQIVLLAFEQLIFHWIVPADIRGESVFTDVILSNWLFEVLLPLSGSQFVSLYGFGIMAVTVLFTAILLERSYRIWGIGYAAAYVAACGFAVYATPFALGVNQLGSYFYQWEIFAIEAAVCFLVTAVSVALGFRLLNKRISV